MPPSGEGYDMFLVNPYQGQVLGSPEVIHKETRDPLNGGGVTIEDAQIGIWFGGRPAEEIPIGVSHVSLIG